MAHTVKAHVDSDLLLRTALATPSLVAAATVNTVVAAAAAHPLLSLSTACGAYVLQYCARKRLAAAIFLLQRYRYGASPPRSAYDQPSPERVGNITNSQSPSPNRPSDQSSDFMADEWSPRLRQVHSLDQLTPDEVAKYANQVLHIQIHDDVDLLERLIADVLDPAAAPPSCTSVLVRTHEGLRFCDLTSLDLECSTFPHDEGRAQKLRDICEASRLRHADPSAACLDEPAPSAWHISVHEDKIFNKFVTAAMSGSDSDAAQSRTASLAGRSARASQHRVRFSDQLTTESPEPDALRSSWLSSVKGAVSSVRAVLAVSSRPNVVEEARAVAREEQLTTPRPTPRGPPPPTKGPPPNPAAATAAKLGPPPPSKTPPTPAVVNTAASERKPPSARPPVVEEDRANLLADIRRGVKLRHVEPKEPTRAAPAKSVTTPRDFREELAHRFRRGKVGDAPEDSW